MRNTSRRIVKLAVTVLVFAVLGACTSSVSSDNASDFSVKIPWFSNNGSVSQQVVTVHGVQDRRSFSGQAAHFYLGPKSQGNTIVGQPPVVHLLKTESGYEVPLDALSVQVVTMYAHMDQLQQQDQKWGVNNLVQQSSKKSWPRPSVVGLNTEETNSSGQMILDNAAYDGAFDAFLFLPYSRPEIPFSINPGVVAHEYFHALFQRIFMEPLGSASAFSPTAHVLQAWVNLHSEPVSSASAMTTDRDAYHVYLIRSINEGFADLWGWLYCGNPEFLLQSIATAGSRSLNQPGLHFNASDIRARAVNAGGVDSGVYLFGTSYSRRIYAAFQSEKVLGRDESQLKQELAQALLRTVAVLREKYQGLGASEYLDPDEILRLLNTELLARQWKSQVLI